MISESITMQAFGPYIQKNTIYFDSLNKEGLFVISGNTGSGKTTILDAICVALYGKSTGGERSFKELRNTSASNETPTIVEYIFSLGEKKYKFVRRLFISLKKRKKCFELKSEHECFTFKNDAWELIESSTESSVKAAAENLLGLDCNQFSKVIILPQGEFKTLLLSSSTDKAKILSKLFETEKWESVTEKIKLMSNDKGTDIKSKLDLKEKILKEHNVSDIYSLESLYKEHSDTLCAERKLQKEILNKIRNINNKINCVKEFNSIKETKALIEKKFYDSEKLFNNAKDSLKEINEYLGKIEKLKKNAQELVSEIVILERSYTDIENFNKIKEQESQLSVILANAKNKLDLFITTEKNISEKIKNFKDESLELEKESSSIPELIKLNEKLKIDYEKYTEFQKLQEELSILKLDYSKGKANLEIKKLHINSLKKECLKLEKSLILKNGKLLLNELKDGELCPICGSIYHPSASLPTEQKNDTQGNDTLSTKLDQIKNELQQTDEDFCLQNESLIKILSKIELKTDELNKIEKNLTQKYNNPQNFNLQLKEAQKKLDNANKLTQRLILLKNELLSLEKEQKTANNSIKNLLNEISKNESELKVLYDHEKLFFNKRSLNFTDKNELRNMIYSKKEEKVLLEKDISILQDSLNELKNNITLTKANYEALKKEYINISKLKEKFLNDIPETETYSIDELNQELATLQLKNEDSLQRIGRLSQTYDYISKSINYLRELCSTIDEDENEYSKIEKLYQLLSGTNLMKTPIKMFVLGIALDDILSRANIYLSNLSHRRYSLSRKSENTYGRAYSGLDIEVFDAYLGAIRPVSTLSGGELFLASLALAFGLSDVIQSQCGKICIDSLFIDEGFGSLDFNTLNTVIDALHDIKRNGRIIGIISHVEEIKNRINAKIEVNTNKYESTVQVLIE